MSDFSWIVENRRSANKFLPGYSITKDEIEEILEQVVMAPSCFNLQHTNYYVGLTPGSIEAMHQASQQYKVSTASSILVVTGNKEAYLDAKDIYEGSKFLKIIDEDEYDYIVNSIKEFHESRDKQFLTNEAIRNASLSAMLFMLSAKDKGWDTCPLIFFNEESVRKSFNIPENEEVVLMIALGKMDESSNRVRGYRKPVREVVHYR